MSPKHSSRRHPSRRPSKPAPRPGFSSVRSFGSSRMSAPMSSSTWRPAAQPGAASAYSLSSVIPVPAAVEPKLNDTQTLEMLALGGAAIPTSARPSPPSAGCASTSCRPACSHGSSS
ncbi:MAG: hypothetical protein M1530_02905 [Candidatus Marsarchaeota archaeon]|nr:hypothetical protein [Candidatus Marsarchaeota archaeon]